MTLGCALALAGSATASTQVTCLGEAASIVGTEGPDKLTGTPERDVIAGLAGDDLIDGAGGDDLICADGDPNDASDDRTGDDEIDGGDGDDYLDGGPGADRLYGRDDRDYLDGKAGDDLLIGGEGNDYQDAGAGTDTILDEGPDGYGTGGDGNDKIDVIEIGNGYYDGGPGDDALSENNGSDDGGYMAGGDGNDTVSAERSYIDGGSGDDNLTGGDGVQYIDAGPGDDRVEGGGGKDPDGDNGDYLDGGEGRDRLHASDDGREYLDGGEDNDVLLADSGDDFLDGGTGDDLLGGGLGADSFDGGDGDDLLDGRHGDADADFNCGDGHDLVRFDEGADDQAPRSRCYGDGPVDTDVDRPGERLDRDGDGLPTRWETDGVDLDRDGDIDLRLPGADPDRKDVYVAVGWTSAADTPLANAFDKVIEAFDRAPVDNPNGIDGIALHLDRVGLLPRENTGDFGSCDTAGYHWDEFDEVRRSVPAAAQVSPVTHHTAILVPGLPACGGNDGFLGWARLRFDPDELDGDLLAGQGAGDFVVVGRGQTALELQTTFMHELGHNLGLGHGGVHLDGEGRRLGADHLNGKPNHLSVMSYNFSGTGLLTHKGSSEVPGLLDFSRFASADLPDLDEQSLDERAGLRGSTATANYATRYLCPSLDGGKTRPYWVARATGAVNWNCANDFGQAHSMFDVKADISGDGELSNTLKTSVEWEHLRFDGGAIGAANAIADAPTTTSVTVSPEPTVQDLEATRLRTALTVQPLVRLSALSVRAAAVLSTEQAGPVPDAQVVFTDTTGKALCSAKTDVSGSAACRVPVNAKLVSVLLAGYKASYVGGDGYAPSAAGGPPLGP